MIISVSSGKGGTGKTTVATSIAVSIANSVYIDCDVEEPNGHILLKPEYTSVTPHHKLLPEIDTEKCTLCNKCVDVCEFNALMNAGEEIILFDELCHSCGACAYFCPEKCITEVGKVMGYVRKGKSTTGDVEFIDGILNIGEETATPLIKEVKKQTIPGKINIVDSPPGTACSMVETVRESDFCILVTESSPFGLSDLKLAIDVLKIINIPFGVVINKYDERYKATEEYLKENDIILLCKIGIDKKIAEDYSRGIIPVLKSEKIRKDMIEIVEKINSLINSKQKV